MNRNGSEVLCLDLFLDGDLKNGFVMQVVMYPRADFTCEPKPSWIRTNKIQALH